MKRSARQFAHAGAALSLVVLLAGCDGGTDAEDLPDPGEQEPVLDGEGSS